MYNANKPSNEDLPSAGKLIKSTILAALGAGVLLVTVVMPAEYGIDPTGAGRMLGLIEMGEIKSALHAEAEADAKAHAPQAEVEAASEPDGAPEKQKQSHGHSHGDGNYHNH